MANPILRLGKRVANSLRDAYSIEEWANDTTFTYQGNPYYVAGYGTGFGQHELPPNSFTGYVWSLYKSSGPVFAAAALRLRIFSQIRFQFQALRNGKPGNLFGTPDLALLENPWPNGQTNDLLARMEQDVTLGGNAYLVREPGTPGRLRRLRPDWVEIVLSAPPSDSVQSDVIGYVYKPGGMPGKAKPVMYDVSEVAHWAPIPDPEAQFRGMSWLTPILREVMADRAATQHELNFFVNGATPQMVVKTPPEMEAEAFEEFIEIIEAKHRGSANGYKTLYLGGGADATVVGKDLKQLEFTALRGSTETRIAAAAGVHPVLVPFSEGLAGSSLNAGNFAAARRSVASATFRPLWGSACAALQVLMVMPQQPARLWYDERDVDFLREDRKDAAAIQQQQAASMLTLVNAGYDPDSVRDAVISEDYSILEWTGLPSVQLQPTTAPTTDDDNNDDTPAPAPAKKKGGDDEEEED